MAIDRDQQPMQASVVAIQGLPRISGCPPSYDLGCKTKKSAGYSHESTEATRSSNIPSGLIVDLSTSSRMVGVGRILVSPSFRTISMVIMLIAAPISTDTLNICVFLTCRVTVGFLGSSYLARRVFPIINSDSFPMTWTVGGSLGFLPGFLTQGSQNVLA